MDLDKIFEGVSSEILTEDVKGKIKTLIEAKVNEKINSKVEELENLFEEYKKKELDSLEEKAVEYVDTYLVDKIDEYMDYVAEEYMKENRLEVEDGLKASMFDKLVGDLKSVLSTNQIKEDEITDKEEIFEENKSLKEELDKEAKINMDLKKNVRALQAKAVFDEVSSELSENDKEKLKNLSTDFSIDDLDELKSKLLTLKEGLNGFDEDDVDNDYEDEEDETLTESVNSNSKLETADEGASYSKVYNDGFNSMWDHV